MSRLIYTEAALADLVRIGEFWLDRGSPASTRAMASIRAGLDNIMSRPGSFRPVPDRLNQRETVIPFGGGSFVARFRHNAETGDVIILRVRHDREIAFG